MAAGQVMEQAPMHQQAPMLLGQLQANCNKTAAEANNSSNVGEQCPRCASHDTKFCYYNNYNTSQPRHFCRACRRYWTLGGSLRNVPIGGSTRKRPCLPHPRTPPPSRRHPVFFGTGAPAATAPAHGLLGSLFALGAAAPLLEGFDLGLGLPMPGGAAGAFSGAGELGAQLHSIGVRGGTSLPLLWPSGLLDNDTNMDAWRKLPSVSGAIWSEEFSAAAAPQQLM